MSVASVNMKNKTSEGNQIKLINFYKQLEIELVSQVEILPLRPKLATTIESNFSGDFDFIVRENDFNTIVNIIYDCCKDQGINFLLNQKAKNKKLFKFFITNANSDFITFEFWTAIEISMDKSKKGLLSAENIFNAIAQNKMNAPAVLSLFFVTHLFHKKKNITSEENVFRFDYFSNELKKKGFLNQNEQVTLLLNKVKTGIISIGEANAEAIEILSHAGVKNANSIIPKLKFFKNRLRNRIFNLNTITPIIGPDGVGKGSVTAKSLTVLKKWRPFPFKQLYRVKGLYKLRLSLITDWKKRPNNQSDESMGYYIFFVALLMTPILRIVKHSKKILLDRYFIDYYGTPIRYLKNNQEPKKLRFYDQLIYLTPVPNNMVFLGCSDAALTSRKNELPLVSVHFLQKLYCEFITVKNVPNVLFISTENEIEVTSEILYEFLRTIK